jgi:hypothetical protein
MLGDGAKCAVLTIPLLWDSMLLVLLASASAGSYGIPQPAELPGPDEAAATPCPVTNPRRRTIPLAARDFFGAESAYWNGALFVGGLWPGSTVVFRTGGPGFILRWLDAPALPLGARIPNGYGETGFRATALIFPTIGCWEVTGKVGEASLTFMTRVIKVGGHR